MPTFPIVLIAIVAALGLLGLVAAAVRHPFLGLAMIVLSVALSGIMVEVGPDGIQLATFQPNPEVLTLRPEFLLVPLGAFSLLLGRLRRREQIQYGRVAWLGAFIGVNILSSVLNSPVLAYSLRMVSFYVVGALGYLGVINYATDRPRLKKALLLSAAVVAGEAAFALLAGGRWLDNGIVRLFGTFQEPVVFSSFMVPLSLLLLGWGMGSLTTAASSRWLLILAYVGLIASAFSMSRASWGTAVLGAGLIVVFAWLWRLRRRTSLVVGVIAGGVLAVIVLLSWIRFAPRMYSSYDLIFFEIGTASGGRTGEDPAIPRSTTEPPGEGVENLLATRLESSTSQWRLDVAREVFRSIARGPLLGMGTLTFGQTHDVFGQPSPKPSDGWIPIGSLLVLHDTGIIGIILFGTFMLAIVWDAVRVVRTGDEEGRYLALGGLAGIVAWLGMEQTSTNAILGFGWVFLGLVSAIASVHQASPVEGKKAMPEA